jgi:hypothetical protein
MSRYAPTVFYDITSIGSEDKRISCSTNGPHSLFGRIHAKGTRRILMEVFAFLGMADNFPLETRLKTNSQIFVSPFAFRRKISLINDECFLAIAE